MKSFGVSALALGLLASAPLAASEARSRAEDPNYEPTEKTAETTDISPGATQAQVALPYFDGEALRAKVPDMVVNRSPGPLRASVSTGLHYPFQFGTVGLGVEAFPVDSLRLWAYYGAGLSGVRERVSFSNDAEASIGLRVLSFDGTYSTDIEASYREPGPPMMGYAPKAVFRAGLPASHAFFLELGVLSGSVPRLKCVEKCSPVTSAQSKLLTVNPQLFYPMGGVRYRFFTSVSSRTQAQINRVFQVELNADVLYEPFNDSPEPLMWGDFSGARGSGFGGFGGVSFILFGRGNRGLLLGVQGGYLPAPASPMFRLSMGFSA